MFTSLPLLYFSFWNNFKLTKNLWDYYKELFTPKLLESNLPKFVQNDIIKLLNTTLFAKAKDWENTHVQHLQFQPIPQGSFAFSISTPGTRFRQGVTWLPWLPAHTDATLSLWALPPRRCLCRSLAYPAWAVTPWAGPHTHVDTLRAPLRLRHGAGPRQPPLPLVSPSPCAYHAWLYK